MVCPSRGSITLTQRGEGPAVSARRWSSAAMRDDDPGAPQSEGSHTRRRALLAAGAAAAGLAAPSVASGSAPGPDIVVDVLGGGDYTEGNGYGIWSNDNGASGAPHDNTIVGNVV